MEKEPYTLTDRRLTLVVSLAMWWAFFFGVALATAIMVRMPPSASFLLALGISMASLPFGAVISAWIAGLLK